MIELLDDLDLLIRHRLDMRGLAMGGVGFGSSASDIPRQTVTEVAASVVARQKIGPGAEMEYYDHDGHRLTFDQVVDHVVRSDGTLHVPDKLSYKIRAGTVVGFAIYGAQLSHFSALSSYEEFLAMFGAPDHVKTFDEPGGGPMSRHNTYWDSRKCLVWDEWDARVTLANLGDYDGNIGP